MDSKNEVLRFVQNLDGAERINFMCDVFRCCCPLELQYFSTYLNGICLADNYKPKPMVEANANDPSYAQTWTKLEDPGTRNKLIITLPFVRCNNYHYAEVIYKFLVETFPGEKFNWEEIFTDENAVQQTNLLLTLAANHPAFNFNQQCYFAELVECMKRSEVLPKQDKSDILHWEPSSCTPLKEPESILPKGDLCASSDLSEENVNGVPQEEPYSSSQSEETVGILLQKEPFASSPSEENLITVSLKGLSLSSPSPENGDTLQKEALSSCSSTENGDVSQDEPLSCSSKENGDVSHDETLSSSSKENGDVSQDEPLSCSSKENGDVSHDETSSSSSKENDSASQAEVPSSLEAKERVTLKVPVISVSLPVVLKRTLVAGRSGKIRSIELKGSGRKGAYRIEVTWSSGRKTELFKSLKQLKNFHEEVVRLSSDSSLLNGINMNISSLPDLSTIVSPGEDLVEHYDKISTYLSNFVALLPLSIRDHDSVIAFFQPHNIQVCRPILVGQGFSQASFMEKPNTGSNFHPQLRNRNYGREFIFRNRQFRNSTGSWNSADDISSLNNSPRSAGPVNQPRNQSSFYNPKPFRQEKWKFYPQISGSSTSCSPQNSPSGSSESSRSSSPRSENTIGTNSSSKGRKNFKNKCAEKELASTEGKLGKNKYVRNWNNGKKTDSEKLSDFGK